MTSIISSGVDFTTPNMIVGGGSSSSNPTNFKNYFALIEQGRNIFTEYPIWKIFIGILAIIIIIVSIYIYSNHRFWIKQPVMHIWNYRTWSYIFNQSSNWNLDLIDTTHGFSSSYVVAFPFNPPLKPLTAYETRVTQTPDFTGLAHHLSQYYSGHVAKKRTAIDKSIRRSIFAGKMTADDPDAVQYNITASDLAKRTMSEKGTWTTISYYGVIIASIYWHSVIPLRYGDLELQKPIGFVEYLCIAPEHRESGIAEWLIMEIVRTESPRGGARRFAFCRDIRPLLFLPVAKLDYYVLRLKDRVITSNYTWFIKRASMGNDDASTASISPYKSYALTLPVPEDAFTYIITTPQDASINIRVRVRDTFAYTENDGKIGQMCSIRIQPEMIIMENPSIIEDGLYAFIESMNWGFLLWHNFGCQELFSNRTGSSDDDKKDEYDCRIGKWSEQSWLYFYNMWTPVFTPSSEIFVGF